MHAHTHCAPPFVAKSRIIISNHLSPASIAQVYIVHRGFIRHGVFVCKWLQTFSVCKSYVEGSDRSLI